jgi:hypothetical protein
MSQTLADLAPLYAPRAAYGSMRALRGPRLRASTAVAPLAPELAGALGCPGRPGIRVIAKQFGVSPMTVQNVSRA